VHIVPAGVTYTVHSGAVGHVLDVLQGKRVQVGAERDGPAVPARVAPAHITPAQITGYIADHAVAAGQQAGGQAGRSELARDQRGRLELPAGEFRVGVQVTAQRHQFGAAGGKPAVELAR
jgi:hypothetical protein